MITAVEAKKLMEDANLSVTDSIELIAIEKEITDAERTISEKFTRVSWSS